MTSSFEFTYERESDSAYLEIASDVTDGDAVEQVVIERAGQGDVIIDFDALGRILGVEVIGARSLFSARTLSKASPQ